MNRTEFEYIQPIVLLVDRDDPAPAVDGIRAVAVASTQMYGQDIHELNDLTVWESWLDGPFAKTVRRADRKTFDKVLAESIPNDRVCVLRGRAEAVGFRPVIATEMPKLLSRLQVTGTSLPDVVSTAVDGRGPAIILNAGLGMSTGKAAAQAAHALFLWYLNLDSTVWAPVWQDIDCSVRFADSTEFDALLIDSKSNAVITDAGRTEIDPGSVTAFAY